MDTEKHKHLCPEQLLSLQLTRSDSLAHSLCLATLTLMVTVLHLLTTRQRLGEWRPWLSRVTPHILCPNPVVVGGRRPPTHKSHGGNKVSGDGGGWLHGPQPALQEG